jgi:hypothetical protein
MISQPHQWAAGMDRTGILWFAKATTFWQRPVRDSMRQAVVSSHAWRGHMARQTRPHNC